jgi:hypothetical protein
VLDWRIIGKSRGRKVGAARVCNALHHGRKYPSTRKLSLAQTMPMHQIGSAAMGSYSLRHKKTTAYAVV